MGVAGRGGMGGHGTPRARPPGHGCRANSLAPFLGAARPAPQARANQRNALAPIRNAPPAGARPGLILDGPTVALDPSVVDVDVAEFERLVADGQPAALEQIASLYRGDLLAGLALAERPFEEWRTSDQERPHELAIQALGRL